jgi:hypothetical protein
MTHPKGDPSQATNVVAPTGTRLGSTVRRSLLLLAPLLFTLQCRDKKPAAEIQSIPVPVVQDSAAQFRVVPPAPAAKEEQPARPRPPEVTFEIRKDSSGYGAFCDSVISANGSLPAMEGIRESVTMYFQAYYAAMQSQAEAGDKNGKDLDSAAFLQFIKLGYDRILAYGRLLAFGVPLPGAFPKLTEKNRATDAEPDSLRKYLSESKPNPSGFPIDGRFLFLGGGPFIAAENPEDGSTATGPDGRPEAVYRYSNGSNGRLALDAIRHLDPIRIRLGFGPEIGIYDYGMFEINGIGSLIYGFTDSIPVFFLTEKGAVPGRLVSVTEPVTLEGMGCVSENPTFRFAASAPIDGEVLGLYIPYDGQAPAGCAIRRGKRHWTADLNGDGVPDLAGVSSTFSGIASDEMNQSAWYLNVEGRWNRIEAAAEIDCT